MEGTCQTRYQNSKTRYQCPPPILGHISAFLIQGGILNKKSRIYGTSDRSDLSVYLSALLKLGSGCSRERIGSGCGRGFLSLWLAYRGHMTNGSGCGSGCGSRCGSGCRSGCRSRCGSGCGSGFPLYSLIGSDKPHDLESAPASPPASAPFCLLFDWIGRSITANGRRERIGSG